MLIVDHRRNTIEQLLETSQAFGVEVDIRSQGKDLIIHHDPYERGILFETWLEVYNHSLLIINVKEEGLEEKIISLMIKYDINDYFFLDQSFPFLLKTSKFNPNCAVRVSEYETIETALSLAGMIRWVWLDTFKPLALLNIDVDTLVKSGFKICLVSPELQGRIPEAECKELVNFINKNNITISAVCTKRPDLWGAKYE